MQNLKQSISSRRIDQILKWAFKLGANQFEPNQPQKVSKLRQASASIGYASQLCDLFIGLRCTACVAQENAGHS